MHWLRGAHRQTSGGAQLAVVYPIEFGDDGHVGGGERYAFELARALSTRLPVKLISFGLRARRERIDDLTIEIYPRRLLVRGAANNPLNPSFLAALRQVAAVHCVGWHCLTTDLSILFAKATGKVVFVTDVGGGASVSLARVAPIGGLVDRFLFLSRHGASLLPEFGDKSDVIYGGADTQKFQPGLEDRRPSVLYVGRIIPNKGIEYLIEAMPEDVPLTIMGRPYHSDYFQMLKRLALSRSVTFVEDASDSDVVRAYQSATVSVLPSVRDSAFGHYPVPATLGLVVLEAMACATPVISTDVGPEPELILDGTTGFVVPPNDASALAHRLTILLRDPKLARRMGLAGRRRLTEEFTWRRTVDRCLEAYARGGFEVGVPPLG